MRIFTPIIIRIAPPSMCIFGPQCFPILYPTIIPIRLTVNVITLIVIAVGIICTSRNAKLIPIAIASTEVAIASTRSFVGFSFENSSCSFFDFSVNPSIIIFIPMKLRRETAIQWSKLVMYFERLTPAAHPRIGITP